MCIFSLNVGGRVTKAKVGETLVRGTYKQHDVLLDKAGQLRCIRVGSELQVEKLDFDRRFFGNGNLHQPYGKAIPAKRIMAWQGKSATVKLVHWVEAFGYAADAIKLPNGALVHLSWLAPGTTMMRTRKVRKDKGVRKLRNLTKVLGLDQIKADIPVSKREAVKG